jgi:hypothetical protein
MEDSPSWDLSISVFLFPRSTLGGAKNLTVKSILWRGSAYRFLPCPFTYLKKAQKKLEEEGTCILSEEELGLNVARVFLAAAETSFSFYGNVV